VDAQLGRVAEWFKAAVLKTAVGASPPWVRIPPLPPRASDEAPRAAACGGLLARLGERDASSAPALEWSFMRCR